MTTSSHPPIDPTPTPLTDQSPLALSPKRRRSKTTSPEPSSQEEGSPQATPAPNQPQQSRSPKKSDTTRHITGPRPLQEQISQLAGEANFNREQLMEVLLADYAPSDFTTKQTTLRLESKVMERLSKLCAKENLSREVLIEALFEYYEQNRSAKKAILTQAKQKASQRQALANQKRAKTMLANLHRLSQA